MNLFENARLYYDAFPMLKAYVDLHYTLSLNSASIQPQPTQEWLEALSDAVMDYWKTGEAYWDTEDGKIAYCDPSLVEMGPGSMPSDQAYHLLMPPEWEKKHRDPPLFVMHKTNEYTLRGEPIIAPQMKILSRMHQGGKKVAVDASMLGFGRSIAEDVGRDVVLRVSQFRVSLQSHLHEIWPHLVLDFYPVGLHNVEQEARKFSLLQ